MRTNAEPLPLPRPCAAGKDDDARKQTGWIGTTAGSEVSALNARARFSCVRPPATRLMTTHLPEQDLAARLEHAVESASCFTASDSLVEVGERREENDKSLVKMRADGGM